MKEVERNGGSTVQTDIHDSRAVSETRSILVLVFTLDGPFAFVSFTARWCRSWQAWRFAFHAYPHEYYIHRYVRTQLVNYSTFTISHLTRHNVQIINCLLL